MAAAVGDRRRRGPRGRRQRLGEAAGADRPDEAAKRLAAVIEEEQADLLLGYDAAGGYGHRDHIRVHQVGARAAELTGVRLLEGTVPREPVV